MRRERSTRAILIAVLALVLASGVRWGMRWREDQRRRADANEELQAAARFATLLDRRHAVEAEAAIAGVMRLLGPAPRSEEIADAYQAWLAACHRVASVTACAERGRLITDLEGAAIPALHLQPRP